MPATIPDWAVESKTSDVPDWASTPAPAADRTPTFQNIETPSGSSEVLKSTDANIIHDLTGKGSATYGGPPKQIAPMSEAVAYAKGAATEQVFHVPTLDIKKDDSIAAAVGKEAYNLVASIPNFMGTPVGIGATAAGGVVPKTAAAIFSGLGFKSVGKTILNSYRNWGSMTKAQKTAAIMDVVGGTAFSGFMAKAAIPAWAKKVAPATAAEVAKTISTPAPQPETITAAAVKTPEGVVTGPNHPEIEKAVGMPETTKQDRNTPQYGYQTDKQDFVTRPEGHKIAEESRQLLKQPETPNQPHSNDIAAKPGGTEPLSETPQPVKKQETAPTPEVQKQKETKPPTKDAPLSAFGKKFYKNTEVAWRQKGKPSEKVNQSTVEALEQITGKKPEIVGMGGAVPAEFQSMAGQDVTGVRQVTREKMAQSGVPTIAQPGQGRNLEQALSHGRELLAKDPNHAHKAMEEFRKSGRFGEDDFDAVRAMLDETRRTGRRIEEKFGTGSPEYANAVDQTLMWDKLAKDMQTQWGRIGVGQQGELDVDTGSVIGMETEYKKATDKNFTPAQRATAGKMVEQIKVAKDQSIKAINDYADQMELGLKDIEVPAPRNAAEARMLFAKYQAGSKMSLPQVKTIWNWAKAGYLEKGVTNFGAVKKGVADDLGIKPDDVTRALSQPKNARVMSAAMYQKMSQARALTNAAKGWVNAQKYPAWARWIAAYPRLRFSLAVFGHGFVPFGTHAPIEFFQPWHYPRLVADYFKMARMVVDSGYHEKVIQDLEHSPRYWFWRQHGAQIDITRPLEEYAEPVLITKLQTGGRGFDILKVLRYQKLEDSWKRLPQSMQTRDMAKLLSDWANHATGVVRMFPVQGKLGRGLQWAMFAPRLVASRFAWTIGDPMKATGILVRKGLGGGKGVTPEEMAFARKIYGERAAVAAVYYGYLLLNQSYLDATDSKQKVNFNDFNRSDWLAFKLDGREIRPWSPEITLVRDALKILQAGIMPQSKWQEISGGRGSSFSDAALGYARGTLSPAAQDLPDFYTRRTMTGQYLPMTDYSEIPLRDRRRGVEPLTWTDYGIQKAAPIPFQEVAVPAYQMIKDEFSHQGISREETKKFLKALADSAAMGMTGIRVQQDPDATQTTE